MADALLRDIDVGDTPGVKFAILQRWLKLAAQTGAGLPSQTGHAGEGLFTDGTTPFWQAVVGSGTVTSVSVTTANGVSGVVANPTTTPAITITLGAITPTTVRGLTITTTTGTFTLTNAKTLAVTNSLTLSGTDATVMTFPTTSATIARTDAANTFVGTQTIGALVATTVNGNTFTTGTGVLTIAAAKTLTASNTLTFTGTDTSSVAFGAGGTVAYVGLANSWGSGIKQTFTPSATTSGFNVGSLAGNPSAPANGDLWYNSSTPGLNARINGATVSLGTGSGNVTTAVTLTAGAIVVGAGTSAVTVTGVSIDGSNNITGINDITISGSLTIGALVGTVAVTNGGTGRATSTTAYGLIAAGTTATGVHQTLAAGATTEILVGGGASALPAWTTATGTGAPVRAGTPTLTTPVIGVATATSINGNTFTTGTYTLTGTAAKTLNFTNTITLSGTDSTTMTFPGTSQTIVGLTSTQSLTNKEVVKRVVTTTDDSTAVIDVTLTDVYELSAVANNTTFSTTGTPKDGQTIVIRWKDAGSAKTLTWDAIFVAIGITLPTTTTTSKWGYVGVQYNAAATKFHAIALSAEA